MRRAGSILRKHRGAGKVYVPKSARDNQYVIAEMPMTDELINLVVDKIDLSRERPYQQFYQTLAKIAFDVIEEHGIGHANFVANSRLVRVRYSEEQQVLQTPQQAFFFYDPKNNSTFKSYFDGSKRSNKVKFLFLATGDELRLNSAEFHKRIYNAVAEISRKVGLPEGALKVRDHQHLTFDLFAKDKGNKETITHSFREIANRYMQQGYQIPEEHTTITYAIVTMPMVRRLLKGTEVNYELEEPYKLVYQEIEQAFTESAAANQLHHAAMVGNGLSPIVRYDETENIIINGELVSLGFNPNKEQGEIKADWRGDQLVDNIRFVFFATSADESNHSYGKFANQVIQASNQMADKLNWKKDKDPMVMRMHQHIIRHL